MFKIADGREQFYQWDLDRQIIVDDSSIVEVHFCNRTDECSLVTEVIDGVANVPNILLQSSFELRVFGYDGKATLHEKKFKVIPRTRPSDYVYTETEVKNYDELSKRIDELEGTGGVYQLVLPAAGEAITDEKTIEILNYYMRPRYSSEAYSELPLCSYNGTLITYWVAGLDGGTCTLTAVRPAQFSFQSYFTEYDLKFNYDAKIEEFIFDGITEYRRQHVSKTSELENDSDFTTKQYVDDAIANIEGGNVDLSEYAKKTQLDNYVKTVDFDAWERDFVADLDRGYASKDYVTNAINTAFAGIATAEGGSY